MENQRKINEMQGRILEHKSMLYATDYVVIRSQETGQLIPEDILNERADARTQINALEEQISLLEKELELEEEEVQL